jgi:adenine/guanine phosphoribosyltransferase-like PRPP-binding protein
MKIILHLSDLHVSTHRGRDGKDLERINSYLTTDTKVEGTKRFVAEFIDYVNKKFNGEELYLMISGDLADRAAKDEYDCLLLILNKIALELKIDKQNVLIVPGDHDINRASVDYAYENSDKTLPDYSFNEAKFRFFSQFYRAFFERDFKFDNVITDFLKFDEEKLVIIGMNSNGRIGSTKGSGYVDIEKLRQELVELNIPKEYSKVALLHHNMVGQYEAVMHGQWDAENKIDVLNILQSENINVIFYGNEHTPASNRFNDLLFVSAAAFAKKGSLNGFRAYKVNSQNGALDFDNLKYALQNEGAQTVHEFGSWSIVELNSKSENLEKIFIRRPVEEQVIIESVELTGEQAEASEPVILSTPIAVNVKADKLKEAIAEGSFAPIPQATIESDYHKKIFQIVKENDLFKSGHFHWNDGSKAHNWIDVPRLLSERENMFTAQKAIFDVIEKNNLEFDLVIGLGMEGIILANYTAVKLDKPYTYLPYSYRYNDHEDYEKNIQLKNEGEYKKILIITDVVKNGKTVNRLFEHETEFFSTDKVTNISVVSLFYTGDIILDPLNPDPSSHIRYYSVSHMKVEKCPYGRDFRETCMIYREKLACVHEFYDASRVEEIL